MGYDNPSKGLRSEDSASGYKMDKRPAGKIQTKGYPCSMSIQTEAQLPSKATKPEKYKPVMSGYGEPKSRYY